MIILFFEGLCLFPLPYSLDTFTDGWMDIGLNYTLTVPGLGSGAGVNMHFNSPDSWGLGFSFIYGFDPTAGSGTFNLVVFFDIPGNNNLVVPLYIRPGFVNGGFGVVVESGLRVFFGEFIGAGGIEEAAYFYTEALVGLRICFYPLIRLWGSEEDISEFEAKFYRIVPSLSCDFGFCSPLLSPTGYYY